jgi:hypothetical protein
MADSSDDAHEAEGPSKQAVGKASAESTSIPAHGAPVSKFCSRADPRASTPRATPVSKDPLHGLTLETIVRRLVAHYGFDMLAELVPVNCFKFEPSIRSSLKFLRRVPWARGKVEELYVSTGVWEDD